MTTPLSTATLASVLGRKARDLQTGRTVTIEAWEPFGAGMCDVKVSTEGRVFWTALSDLRPLPGEEVFPRRLDVCRMRDAEMLRDLRETLEDMKGEIRSGERWPGAEFGKAIVGQSLVGAIEDVKKRLESYPS